MKTSLDCLPCLLRQATDAIRLGARGSPVDAMVVRELLLASTTLDFDQPPPHLAGVLQAQLREITGCADPYSGSRRQLNRLALELLPPLAEAVARSADPFGTAVRLAITGNAFGSGTPNGNMATATCHGVMGSFAQPLLGPLAALRRAAQRARRILYLCDNAGEIVFDRLLIEQLPRGAVTVVVRGRPATNGATREDAAVAGLSAIAEMIDNDSALPGTVLTECTPELRRRFAAADLVLAKGAANFESLRAERAPLFCLLHVACSTVAVHCGRRLGSHLIWRLPRGTRPPDPAL